MILPLDDPRWSGMEGGYRLPYDARPLILRFANQAEEEKCWQELWNKLHHQGDIGDASYAVLPHLVEIYRDRRRTFDIYLYAAILEQCRWAEGNPPLPDWLAEGYRAAQDDLLDFAITDVRSGVSPGLLRMILAFIAGYAGAPGHSKVIISLDFCDELIEIAKSYGERLDD